MGSFEPPGQKNIIEEIIPAKTENDCNNRIDTVTWWFSVLKVVCQKKYVIRPFLPHWGGFGQKRAKEGKNSKKNQHANRREGGAIGRDLQKLAFCTHFWGRQQWKNLGTRRGMGSCPQGGNTQRAGAPHNFEKKFKTLKPFKGIRNSGFRIKLGSRHTSKGLFGAHWGSDSGQGWGVFTSSSFPHKTLAWNVKFLNLKVAGIGLMNTFQPRIWTTFQQYCLWK